MGNKYKKHHRRRLPPWVWLGGTIGIVVLLFVFGFWQSGAFARQPPPSRGTDPADLLPLAQVGSPLRGRHDMALIPERVPAPRPAAAGVPAPRLELPSTSHDFGRIDSRLDVTHIFALQNVGTADLEIDNLVTSCGCTAAELSSRIIPPGQRADLTVIFDANLHPTNGAVTRLVWFATNDPTQPWVEMRIYADVQ